MAATGEGVGKVGPEAAEGAVHLRDSNRDGVVYFEFFKISMARTGFLNSDGIFLILYIYNDMIQLTLKIIGPTYVRSYEIKYMQLITCKIEHS